MAAVSSASDDASFSPNPGRGVRLFGFRLLLASDDFVFPALIEVISRTVFSALIAIILICYIYPDGFKVHPDLNIFLMVVLALFITQAVVSGLLCRSSSKGTIWDPEESRHRRMVVPLVHASIAFTIVELGVNAFGVYALWKAVRNDEDRVRSKAHLGILLMSVALWIILIIKLTFILISVKELNDLLWKSRRVASPESTSLASVSNDRDGICISVVSRLCFQEDNVHYFHEAAEIFAEIFRQDMFLMSDILCALVLLFTKSAPAQQHPEVSTGVRRGQDGSIRGLADAETMLRYMEYSYAMYGSALYLISSRSTLSNCGRVLRHMTCCGCCCFGPQRSDFVVEGGCCYLGVATVKATLTDLDEDDIVYMSFKNVALVTPFMVIIDRKMGSIVVSIRGSGSVPDLLTNLTAKPKVMDDFFKQGKLDRKFLAHGGMIQAALYIYNKLVNENILDKAFTRCEGYRIVVTGHSLGAGIASILGFFLRMRYPETFVFAYGPPGGLLSHEAWKESKKFTCSVIMGHDFVPRLSLISIHEFRELMRTTLLQCQEPKYKILYQGLVSGAKSCLSCKCCGDDSSYGIESYGSSVGYGSINQSESLSTLRSTLDSDSDVSDLVIAAYGSGSNEWPVMLPPGVLFHIQGSRGRLLDLVEIRNPLSFVNIDVSPYMLTDHFPQSYVNALRTLTSQELHMVNT